jgi:hypothetical protein
MKVENTNSISYGSLISFLSSLTIYTLQNNERLTFTTQRSTEYSVVVR